MFYNHHNLSVHKAVSPRLSKQFNMISGRVHLFNAAKKGYLAINYPMSCRTAGMATAMDSYKPCHSLRAPLAAALITQKVGMSVDAQEGFHSMLRSILATVYI